MASGLPIIGIRSAGVADTVVDGETGLLSAPDLPSYVAVLTRLVSEGGTRQLMGRRAREAADQYAIERTSALLESHYSRLAAEGPRRGRRRWQVLWRKAVDRLT